MGRRPIAIVVVSIALAIVLWLLAGDDASRSPPAPASATPADPHPTADLLRASDSAEHATAPAAARAPRTTPPAAAPPIALTPKQSGASLIEQLVAIHAIGSQADVSAFLVKNAELAAAHADAYCAEARRLAKPLPPGGHDRDAAIFLAPLTDWATEPPRHGKLHLPDALVEKIKQAPPGEWPGAITDADLAGLDFDWMRRLHEFDHWSLLGAGPMTEPNPPKDLDGALPYYVTLVQWAKLRLAIALKLGGFAQASRDVRQLAILVRSHEILLSEMIAIAMLRAENEAAAFAKDQLDGVVPYPPADLERLRLVSRHADKFFFPGVDPAVMKKVAECTPAPCSALVEAAWVHASIGQLSPDDTTSDLWSIVDEAKCDRDVLAQLPSNELTPEEAKDMFVGDQPIEKLFPR